MDIGDNIDGTQELFSQVAEKVHLHQLRDVTMTGFKCDGADLQLFARSHAKFEALEMSDFSIVGSVGLSDTLQCFSQVFMHLKIFGIRRVGQGGFRTIFESLGNVDVGEAYPKPKEELTGKFLQVHRAQRHYGLAEEWEGVSRKLVQLADDVAVTVVKRDSRLDWE